MNEKSQTLADKCILPRETMASVAIRKMRFGPNPENCYQALTSHGLSATLLDAVMNSVDRDNPSVEAPYHGSIHVGAMVTAVHEALCWYRSACDDALQNRSLIIAAAFHDYDHTGGREKDYFNIQRAVHGFNAWHQKRMSHVIVHGHEYDSGLVSELIHSTEFPYPWKAKNLMQGILRDADLMMPYLEDEYRLPLFLGLYTEQRIRDPLMSKMDYVDNVLKFNSEIVWNTEWAREKAIKLDFNARVVDLVHSLNQSFDL